MELAVQARTVKGKKLKKIRKEDQVPCIVYGRYIDAPVNLMCQKQEFLKIYKNAGYSMPITLKGDDLDQLVLIHDIQVDPVTDYVMHVDFITLKKGEKVETDVQIVLEGNAPVEKLGLGNVQQVKDTVSIEALPKDLPHNIVVDISGFEDLSDVVFVKDLIVGKGVEITDDLEQAVVTVTALVEEEEEEEPLTDAAGEPLEEAEGEGSGDSAEGEEEKKEEE